VLQEINRRPFQVALEVVVYVFGIFRPFNPLAPAIATAFGIHVGILGAQVAATRRAVVNSASKINILLILSMAVIMPLLNY
jgi:hypothetical protein